MRVLTKSRRLTLICCLALPLQFHCQTATNVRADEPAALKDAPAKEAPTKEAPSQEALAQEIAEALEPIREKHQLPALAGAIVTGRGLLATAAVGKRRANSDVPVTADDLWHMGSCTKALTASMIASLVEEGKLRWDTTVEQSFPDVADRLPAEFRSVTLLHLLSHRSGLSSNLAFGSYSRDEPVEAQRAKLLEHLTRFPLALKPGTRFEYSNTGYIVAAMMAERAAKTSWEDLMRRRIFEPLDMKQATFRGLGDYDNLDRPWPHEADGKPNGKPDIGVKDSAARNAASKTAAASDAGGNPVKNAIDAFRVNTERYFVGVVLGDDGEAPVAGPAGATMRLSMQDWSKFVADQLRGDRGEPALFKAETYQTLHKPPFAGIYALGWGVQQRPWGNGRVLTHSGSNAMNFSVVWIAPKRDFAVQDCTNQGGPSGQAGADGAASQLIRLYEKHYPASAAPTE